MSIVRPWRPYAVQILHTNKNLHKVMILANYPILWTKTQFLDHPMMCKSFGVNHRIAFQNHGFCTFSKNVWYSFSIQSGLCDLIVDIIPSRVLQYCQSEQTQLGVCTGYKFRRITLRGSISKSQYVFVYMHKMYVLILTDRACWSWVLGA